MLLGLAAGSAIALCAAVANAAPVQDWSGFYVGGVVGANVEHGHFSLPGDTSDVLLSDHANATGLTGGGLIGFNKQYQNYVVGIEGDVVAGAADRKVTACTAIDGCFTPAHDSFTTYNRLKQGVSGHLRVRLGYAMDRTLVYVAGGYSVADTRLDLVGDCFNPANPPTPTVYTFSRGKTVSGFNIGAGVERAVTDHIAVRAEYVYDDFGGQTYRGDAPEWNDRRIDLHNSNFRVAASYRF